MARVNSQDIMFGSVSYVLFFVVQLLSRVQLHNPMNCSTPGSSVLHRLPAFAQTHVHWVSDYIYLILCRPLLLLPPIPPSIRGFSSESALRMRWPKYWSCSFSISPSNEYSGLISFRTDCFHLLAVQGILKSLLQQHNLKASILQHSSLWSNSHTFVCVHLNI